MKVLNAIVILVAAFLVVFCQAYFNGLQRVIGVQIDLLPVLMVYASLTSGVTTLAILAVWAGLWFDSLSANPLGVSILPLFMTGFGVYLCRDLILRDQVYAQFVTGLAASAFVPLQTLLIIIHMGHRPLVGWQSLWQWLVMAVAGGLMTPVCFFLLDRFDRAFSYQPLPDPGFRNDREIKRGRH